MTMIKKLAWLFAVVFVLVGVLGFVPGVTSNGHLLGLFEVDTVHNLVHLLTGILFGISAMMGAKAASGFFKLFGVVYLLVALLGFFFDGAVLGLINTNGADNWLHLVLGLVIAGVGFGVKADDAMGSCQSGAAACKAESQPPSGGTA